MKVKLKTNGGYKSLVNKVGDIVYAIEFNSGYKCFVEYESVDDTIKDYLYFSSNEVELFENTDSIVGSVINQFKQRSEVGINKYGVTLDRNDLTTLEWIEHAKQEAMDFVLYLEKLKQQLS